MYIIWCAVQPLLLCLLSIHTVCVGHAFIIVRLVLVQSPVILLPISIPFFILAMCFNLFSTCIHFFLQFVERDNFNKLIYHCIMTFPFINHYSLLFWCVIFRVLSGAPMHSLLSRMEPSLGCLWHARTLCAVVAAHLGAGGETRRRWIHKANKALKGWEQLYFYYNTKIWKLFTLINLCKIYVSMICVFNKASQKNFM